MFELKIIVFFLIIFVVLKKHTDNLFTKKN